MREKWFIVQSRLAYMPRRVLLLGGVVMGNLMTAISVLQDEMERQLKVLKEETLRGQEEVTTLPPSPLNRGLGGSVNISSIVRATESSLCLSNSVQTEWNLPNSS